MVRGKDHVGLLVERSDQHSAIVRKFVVNSFHRSIEAPIGVVYIGSKGSKRKIVRKENGHVYGAVVGCFP